MIREEDLREAIAECEGIRNPSASTCIKLASYYALLDRRKGIEQKTEDPPSQYSYASSPEIPYGDTEFSRTVERKGMASCYPVIEETMEALAVILPKLYNATMRKLDEV